MVFRLRTGLDDGPRAARVMIGVLALACFVTGFITAWLVRTGYVMTQISWAQERMERKVRYWQGEAIHARAAAELAERTRPWPSSTTSG
jgi:hypothetical protein